MVGAATASLPELQQGGDNYDYRYVWVRDQCWAARAAARAGIGSLLDDAVRFLGRRVLDDGADLAPAYTVRGERVPGEERLDVPGYPGGGDRIGNRGGAQFQLDAFGELLLLFAEAAGHDRLDADGWRAAETAVEAIEKRWTEPDAGVWELEDRIWTHSRLICAAGLRQLAEHAAPRLGATWSALADRIVAHVASTSLHVDGRWQRADDDPRHDAALLLPALRGAIPPDDPRSRRTLQTFLDDLTSQGYAYRFRVDERPLGAAEGAFLVCTSSPPSPSTRSGTISTPATTSSARARPADRRGCSPRSSTSPSGSSGATSRKRSCTRYCSSARPRSGRSRARRIGETDSAAPAAPFEELAWGMAVGILI